MMRVTVRIKRAKVHKICSPAQASAQEIGARPQATLLTLPPLCPSFLLLRRKHRALCKSLLKGGQLSSALETL